MKLNISSKGFRFLDCWYRWWGLSLDCLVIEAIFLKKIITGEFQPKGFVRCCDCVAVIACVLCVRHCVHCYWCAYMCVHCVFVCVTAYVSVNCMCHCVLCVHQGMCHCVNPGFCVSEYSIWVICREYQKFLKNSWQHPILST